MKYIILLLLSTFCFGQTLLNETFSNFLPDTTGTICKGLYPFGATGVAVEADLSSYANTLTGNNFSANYADELTSGNPIISGQNVIKFNGSSEFFNIANAAADDFDMSDGEDFSYVYVLNMGATAYSGVVAAMFNRYYFRASNVGLNGAGCLFLSYDGTDTYYRNKESAVFTASNWDVVIVNWDDSDSVGIHINGTELSGTVTTGTFANQGNMGGGDFYIGRFLSGQYFGEKIALVGFFNSVLTSVQIKEFGYLANGWKSLSGNVTRNNWAFTQGVITDTVYYNTALAAGNWKMQVDIDGNSGGETYRILTSADALTWTDLGSGTAPASSTTKVFSGKGLGYIGLAVSSAADTVFFDNLTVNLAVSNKFKTHSRYNEFKGF
jgi:hypothetical protein